MKAAACLDGTGNRQFIVTLDEPRARGAIVLPRGLARRLVRGEPSTLQLLMDGADGTTTRIALGYAFGVIQQVSRDQLTAGGYRVAPPIDSAIHWPPSPRTSLATTRAPSRAKRRAIASPIP